MISEFIKKSSIISAGILINLYSSMGNKISKQSDITKKKHLTKKKKVLKRGKKCRNLIQNSKLCLTMH